MSAEAERTAKRRRRIRLWHIPVATIVVLVVAMLVMRWHWRRAYRQRVAAVATAGYPVRVEALAAWYPAPASGENGAQAVLDAAGGYVDRLTSRESQSLGRLYALGRRDSIEEETEAALKRLVADNEETLTRLHEVAGFDHYYYDIVWSDISGWRVEPIGQTSNALTLLERSVLLAFEEGRVEDAIESIVTLSVISQSFAEIPTLSGYLSGPNSRESIIGSLERGMDRLMLTDEQLRRVERAIGADDTPERLERALASHMCMLLPYFTEPASWAPDAPLPPAPVLEAYEALGLAAREACVVIEAMESYMAVTRRPLREWPSAASAIDAALEEKFFGCLVVNSEGGFKLSHILLRHLRHMARLRAARGAMAVERYRLARGALPSSLDDLVPSYLDVVPEDPFTGQPLRYEKLGKGFVVYSVGPDGRDDGGWEEPPYDLRRGGRTYDLTFTVER